MQNFSVFICEMFQNETNFLFSIDEQTFYDYN